MLLKHFVRSMHKLRKASMQRLSVSKFVVQLALVVVVVVISWGGTCAAMLQA